MSEALHARGWTVPAAAGLAALETTAVIAVLVSRHSRSAPLSIACVAVRYPFCLGVLRRRAGAWLALVLWEGTGVFAAVVAPRVPLLLRVLELGLAAGVLALLGAALPLFPRMERLELPDR
ncbi:MAG: hypothetical protein QOI20_785 [Acidimicrobiaceae bacterium]|jgi:hypothetical protein|nr:hypothetical protein [Acidimicrobiaceae bacterium]